jgi:hypothetical protein
LTDFVISFFNILESTIGKFILRHLTMSCNTQDLTQELSTGASTSSQEILSSRKVQKQSGGKNKEKTALPPNSSDNRQSEGTSKQKTAQSSNSSDNEQTEDKSKQKTAHPSNSSDTGQTQGTVSRSKLAPKKIGNNGASKKSTIDIEDEPSSVPHESPKKRKATQLQRKPSPSKRIQNNTSVMAQLATEVQDRRGRNNTVTWKEGYAAFTKTDSDVVQLGKLQQWPVGNFAFFHLIHPFIDGAW